MDHDFVVIRAFIDDTLSGESLFVQADSNHGSIKVNGVTLSQADILAANGMCDWIVIMYRVLIVTATRRNTSIGACIYSPQFDI